MRYQLNVNHRDGHETLTGDDTQGLTTIAQWLDTLATATPGQEFAFNGNGGYRFEAAYDDVCSVRLEVDL